MKLDYFEIAKKMYCTEGNQVDCRDCELFDILLKNNYNPASCRTKLIEELVKIIETERSEANGIDGKETH